MSETYINIDYGKWENPFKTSNFSNEKQILLYEQYIRKTNLFLDLIELENQVIITSRNPEKEWTELEVIKKLLCELGYSKELCMIHRDILNNKEGIIVHQVNCQGVMGGGIAGQIKEKYPIVYKNYQTTNVKWVPGMIQMVAINPVDKERKLFVCNLAGQNDFGRDKNKVYTDYFAVREGFKKLKNVSKIFNLPVFVPYKMGCGLANGNWNKYSEIIYEELPNAIVCFNQPHV